MNKALQRILDITDFDRPLILAVSGGKDSTTLLDMVMQFKKKFTNLPEIVHFNHGLRPESKDEEKFIESLGDKYGLDVKIFRLDTPGFKKTHNLSMEEAARKLRYLTLREYTSTKKTGGTIYTAHTAGDQAETVLFRIITGTGRTGLEGIRTHMKLKSGWRVKRPLLGITTEEIEGYARKNKIKYVTDSSNFDLSIPRNYIRKNIIPSLKEINPALERNIKKLTDILQEEECFLNNIVKEKLKKVKIRRENDKIRIELNPIISYNKWIRRRLIRDISPVVLDYNRIDLIEEIIKIGGTYKYADIGDGWKAGKSYGELIFEKDRPAVKDFFYNLAIGKKTVIPPAKALLEVVEASPKDLDYNLDDTEYFDLDKLDTDNLWVRSRRDGDRMSLFGMKGSKKIKDLCIDLKLRAQERAELMVVGSHDKILWAAPYRRSAEAAVGENTERILKIIYESG